MTTTPGSSAPIARTRGERLSRGLALLRALERDGSPAGRDCAAELAGLRARGAHVLAEAVRRPVAMPYLAGLDVGARITYEGPPPYEHALEYVDAAAQRFSWDDPRGVYEAAAAQPPDPEIAGYLADLTAFCRVRGLGATWAPRMLAFAATHAAADPDADAAAGEHALDALAPRAAALAREASWTARRLLDPHADAASIVRDLGAGASVEDVIAALHAFAEACSLPIVA